MRIARGSGRRGEEGGVMLITLLTAMVLGVALSSYLSLVASQNRSVMRSLSWNSAVGAMEAGVEEALTQVNHNGVTNLTGNGWTLKGDGWYQKEVNLGGDFGYVTRIQPMDPPVIVSTGIAPSPISNRGLGSTASSILSAAQDNANFVCRAVRVTTRRDALFGKGMVAKGQIDLAGNNIATDSFDSGDAAYSTAGRYDPAKVKDNGDVATNLGVEDSLNVGNAEVMGKASTGPGGSIDIGPNGAVGDYYWVTGGHTGIQAGRSSADMNVSFPSVEAPFNSGTIPPNRDDGTVEWDYVLGDGDYYVSSLSGKVLVEGDARLYVSSSVAMSGKDMLMITNGGSLKMYVAATSASLGGNGVINADGQAMDFMYYGLDSNTSLSLGGNAAFIGVIYAPNAAFQLGGGGNDTLDFIGASITRTVKMNGHFHFHYDEALSRTGPSRGYIPNSWNEMGPTYGLPAAALAGMQTQ